jgi:copper chaperone CopZ
VVAGALEGLPGVKVLNVSFAESRAEVLYDPVKASLAGMKKALERYGFKASPLGKGK